MKSINSKKALKQISQSKKIVKGIVNNILDSYIDVSNDADRLSNKVDEQNKTITQLEDKVFKSFIYNKTMRRKTKAISKYFDYININKLSEDEAKNILKQIKSHIRKIAYSYKQELFY